MPDVDDLVVTLAGRDGTVETLALDFENRGARTVDDLAFLRRDDHVVDADRDAGLRRVEEAEVFDVVEHLDGEGVAVVQEDVVDELLQPLLLEKTVDERDLIRKMHVEDDASDGRVDQLAIDFLNLGVNDVLIVELRGEIDEAAGDTHADRREQLDFTVRERELDFVERAERLAFTLRALLRLGQVVAAKDEILRRNGERLAVRRREDVVRGQHEHLTLDLRFR